MLLKYLLLENGEGGNLAATVVSRSGIAAEDANARIGGQLRIDVTDGGEKVRVNRIVPDSVVRLGCGLPDLLELSSRHVLASNVPVERRLLRRTAELHHDGPHSLGEVGMANHCDS